MSAAVPDRMAAVSAPRQKNARWIAQTWLLLWKDLLIEIHTGEVLITSGFFAVLVVVIGSLSFYLGPSTRGQVAAGCIWLAITFAAVLALGKLWHREREDGALEALLVAPLAPSAIFAGKALALLIFLFVVEALVLPTAALFFSIDLAGSATGLLLLAGVTTPGIAATATLFGAMTARTRARDLVVAVVVFPLLAPTVLTAVVATRQLLDGAPLAELADYLKLIGIFDVTFVSGGLGLFGVLVED